MKNCQYCRKKVASECTGNMTDHCTWCGDPVGRRPGLYEDEDRFCDEECIAENKRWDEEKLRKHEV